MAIKYNNRKQLFMKVSKMSDIILLIKTNIEEYVLIAHFKVHV